MTDIVRSLQRRQCMWMITLIVWKILLSLLVPVIFLPHENMLSMVDIVLDMHHFTVGISVDKFANDAPRICWSYQVVWSLRPIFFRMMIDNTIEQNPNARMVNQMGISFHSLASALQTLWKPCKLISCDIYSRQCRSSKKLFTIFSWGTSANWKYRYCFELRTSLDGWFLPLLFIPFSSV